MSGNSGVSAILQTTNNSKRRLPVYLNGSSHSVGLLFLIGGWQQFFRLFFVKTQIKYLKVFCLEVQSCLLKTNINAVMLKYP